MQNKNFYFKIPFLDKVKSQSDSDLHICGLIDCSGSMQPWWEWLADFWNECIPKTNLFTLTFDNRVKIVPDNILNK